MPLAIPPSTLHSSARARVGALGLITAALALGLATPASAVLIDFNSGATGLSSNFTEFGQTTGTQFTWSSSAGIGGTGGVYVAGSPDILVYNPALTGFSAGTTSIEVSSFYKARTALNGGANVSIASGLVADTGVAIGTTTSGPYLMLVINSLSNPAEQTDFQASFRSSDGTTTTISGKSDIFDLTDSNWYKFTTVYTYDAQAGTFSATVLIQDYGASGSDAPTTVLSFTSTSVANTTIASAAALYAEIRTGAPSYGGAKALDDISIAAVPEPAVVGLVLAGVGLLCAVVSRRRNFRPRSEG